MPDISLYDHLKTTAAIAACLLSGDAEKPFLLVAGDFAGIQTFIYHIHAGAGGLTRRLRARSFFVSLSGESVAHGILKALELPLTNLVINAGGHFYLLLPNNDRTRRVVQSVREQVDDWTVRQTGAEVRLVLTSRETTRTDLRDFATVLAETNRLLAEEKLKPLRGYLQDEARWKDNAQLLLPDDALSDVSLCQSCRRRAGEARVRDGITVHLCPSCSDDESVGRLLPGSRYVAFYDDNSGMRALPVGSFTLARDLLDIRGAPHLVLDCRGRLDAPPRTPLVPSFHARHVPVDELGMVRTFDWIAQQSTGRKALGYLKADVDYLGYLFESGLRAREEVGRDRTSISRLTSMSRSLEMFFGGVLDRLAEEREFDPTYVVYSGGDDLLCVGPWDLMFRLAARIRDEFRRYTCGNPSWSLSAGVAVVRHDMPVIQAVEEADALLEAAKNAQDISIRPVDAPTKKEVPCKDSVAAFDTVIPWSLFADVLDTARELGRLVREAKLEAGKIRRLLHYAEMYRPFQTTRQVEYLEYAPLLAYDLRRNWKTLLGDTELKKWYLWAHSLIQPGAKDMPAVTFVCTHALYMAR